MQSPGPLLRKSHSVRAVHADVGVVSELPSLESGARPGGSWRGLTPRWGSRICAAPTRRTTARHVPAQSASPPRVESRHLLGPSQPAFGRLHGRHKNGKQRLRRERSDRRAVSTGEFLEPAAFFGVARRGRAPNARLLRHNKPSPSQHHSRHGLGAGMAGFANRPRPDCAAVVNPNDPVRRRKIPLNPTHLSLRQQEQISHVTNGRKCPGNGRCERTIGVATLRSRTSLAVPDSSHHAQIAGNFGGQNGGEASGALAAPEDSACWWLEAVQQFRWKPYEIR
jgi:hypothetical protein